MTTENLYCEDFMAVLRCLKDGRKVYYFEDEEDEKGEVCAFVHIHHDTGCINFEYSCGRPPEAILLRRFVFTANLLLKDWFVKRDKVEDPRIFQNDNVSFVNCCGNLGLLDDND